MNSTLFRSLVALVFVLLAYGTYMAMEQGPGRVTESSSKVMPSSSPVTLEVASTSEFTPGETAIIDTPESGVQETQTISAVPDATHIVVAKLENQHDGSIQTFIVADKVPLSKQLTSPAPTEQSMGDAQRIFYYHVPAATAAYTLFFINFVASIIFIVKRSELADIWALISAEVGLVFATVVLITGPIWGRFAWNTWWAWEPRLTTFLILWLLYVSYLVLRRSAEAASGATLAAALAIFAFLDVPFSYVANRFRGHHPPPITLVDPGMKFVFTVNMFAFLLFAGLILWYRREIEGVARTIAAAYIERAHRGVVACVALPAAMFLFFQERQNLNPTHFMLGAYIATWVVYIGYLALITAKVSRLKKEAAELGM